MKQFLTSLAEAGKPKSFDPDAIRYAGLNIRLLANLIDMLILMLLTMPLLFFRPTALEMPANMPPSVMEAYNLQATGQISDQEFKRQIVESGYLEQQILPKILMYSFFNFLIVGVIYVLCWWKFNSTPGKLLFGVRIVDEQTMQDPSVRQYIIRFIGYIVSMIPLFIGYLMIGMNKKKKGLHDFMAGTVVIYGKPTSVEWEAKKKKWRTYIMLVLVVISIIYLSQTLGK